jgi:rfaE bifunctional protein kinase chain/domain
MKTFQGMSQDRLGELLARFGQQRIGVLGDFFLDKYLDVDPRLGEASLETGKVAYQVVAVRHSPGAAGTVSANLAALGAGRLHAIGLTGDDGESYDLRKGLAAIGVDTAHLHCDAGRMTPTYLKPRDLNDPSLAGEHSRLDTKNRTPTSEALQLRIVRSLDALVRDLDAVVVLDQVEEDECGVVTRLIVDAVAERAARQARVVFWADSRRRIHHFRQVIIKPNQFEAVGWESPPPGAQVPDGDLQEALGRLRRRTGAPVFVTRGPRGMVVTDPEPMAVPGVQVPGPIDPTGAGDSVTAGAVLALAAGAALAEAALVGNLVASITIQQLATTGTASPKQLRERLELWRAQQSIA